MKISKLSISRTVLILLASIIFSGCSTHDLATRTNEVKNHQGKDFEFLNTTQWGFNLLFAIPVAGSPTLEDAVDSFTLEAKERGAKQVRIVKNESTTLWYVFPPFSFIVTPTYLEVSGDLIYDEDWIKAEDKGFEFPEVTHEEVPASEN